MKLLCMAWLVVLSTCFFSKKRISSEALSGHSVRFIQRQERKLKDENVQKTLTLKSKIACVAACSESADYLSISWNSVNKQCIMSQKETATDGQDSDWLESAAQWITMAKIVYPVAVYAGNSGATLTFNEAVERCRSENSTIASPSLLLEARAMGYHFCRCAWLSDESKGFVLQYPSESCTSRPFTTGIIYCYDASRNVLCILD